MKIVCITDEHFKLNTFLQCKRNICFLKITQLKTDFLTCLGLLRLENNTDSSGFGIPWQFSSSAAFSQKTWKLQNSASGIKRLLQLAVIKRNHKTIDLFCVDTFLCNILTQVKQNFGIALYFKTIKTSALIDQKSMPQVRTTQSLSLDLVQSLWLIIVVVHLLRRYRNTFNFWKYNVWASYITLWEMCGLSLSIDWLKIRRKISWVARKY